MNEIQKKSQQLKKRQDEQAALNAKIKVLAFQFNFGLVQIAKKHRLIQDETE